MGGSELQGDGERHVDTLVLSLPHYQWVKEDAIGDSRRPLLVTLAEMDSNTHGTQCEAKKKRATER